MSSGYQSLDVNVSESSSSDLSAEMLIHKAYASFTHQVPSDKIDAFMAEFDKRAHGLIAGMAPGQDVTFALNKLMTTVYREFCPE